MDKWRTYDGRVFEISKENALKEDIPIFVYNTITNEYCIQMSSSKKFVGLKKGVGEHIKYFSFTSGDKAKQKKNQKQKQKQKVNKRF